MLPLNDMKKTFTLGIAALLSLGTLLAQDVFNPNDPVITYDPARPPVQPANNVMAKWVRTKVYTWNTDNFKCYIYNGMAFRLRYPTGYNPSDKSKKYPVVVFFHGGGETAPITDNETQLFYTAQKFENYANEGKFNAFYLYPLESQPGIWEDAHFKLVNNILDSLNKYHNTDPDRVLTIGLSMGGFASLRYSSWYAQRSSLAIGASPALIETLATEAKDNLVYIPLWLGNGGLDLNPNPYYVQNFVSYIQQKGGNIRHNFYPLLDHQVWFSQFEEPYLLPYFQAAHKANPVVLFGRNQFDQVSSIDARIGISAGFYEYQWQRENALVATATNGVTGYMDTSVITSSTGNEIKVHAYGNYRVRFKRTAASGWSDWSAKPAYIYRGLKYRFYRGSWNSLPDFNALLAASSGTSPNVDLEVRPSGIDNQYAMIWEGKINLPAAGEYTFETISRDGSKIYFNTPYSYNAPALVNNDGSHGASSASGKVTVPAAGTYPITITYFQNSGAGTMQVYWAGPGFSRQLVPDSAFTELSSDKSAPSAPANLRTGFVGRTVVDLEWDNASDNKGVVKYEVYADKILKGYATGNSVTVHVLSENALHTFEVKAVDAAGNVSPASSVTARTIASGLRYRYYEGNWDALPEFNALTPVKSGLSANLDMSPRKQSDNFGFVWEGFIQIKTPGIYTFETISDDGSKFYFNTFYAPFAIPLVVNDGAHAQRSIKNSIFIPFAGFYPFAATYFEKTGGESMQLFWEGPGISRQPIPDQAFTESSGTTTSTGSSGTLRVMADGTDPLKLNGLSAYPNPFIGNLKINFYNASSGNDVRASIYDLGGKLMYSKHFGKLPAGTHTLDLNIQNRLQLDIGTYIARLQVNGVVVKTWKVIKARR